MHKVSARHSERISTLLEAARTKRTELVDFYIQMPRDYIIGTCALALGGWEWVQWREVARMRGGCDGGR